MNSPSYSFTNQAVRRHEKGNQKCVCVCGGVIFPTSGRIGQVYSEYQESSKGDFLILPAILTFYNNKRCMCLPISAIFGFFKNRLINFNYLKSVCKLQYNLQILEGRPPRNEVASQRYSAARRTSRHLHVVNRAPKFFKEQN